GGTVFIAARLVTAEWSQLAGAVYVAGSQDDATAAVLALQAAVAARQGYASGIVLMDGTTLYDTVEGMKAAVEPASWGTGTLAQLQGSAWKVGMALALQTGGWTANTHAAADAGGGAGGTYGAGLANGEPGPAGAPGAKTIVPVPSEQQWPASGLADLLYLHPEQCALLLQKARLLYYTGDPVSNPSAIADALVLLQRLIQRTAPFAAYDPDAPPVGDALYDAYTDPSCLDTLGSSDCIGTLGDVHRTASMLVQQIRSGLDVFSHPYDFTPLGSYDFYQSELTQMLEWFAVLEAGYNGYFQALQDGTDAQQPLRGTIAEAQSVIAQARSENAALFSAAASTLSAIRAFTPTLRSQLTTLDGLIAQFQQQIEDAFDFDLKTFISALGQVAFAPESGFMWAAQAGELAYTFSSTITGADGTPIPKDYLLSEVSAIDGTVDSINEGYRPASDGTLDPTDPGGNMLIAQAQAFDAAIAPVRARFKTITDEIDTAFGAYLQTVQQRNQRILDYNAMILMIGQREQLIADTKAKRAALSATLLQGYSPDLPVMTAFVSRAYHRARDLVLGTLYQANHAFRFWALNDTDVVSETLAGADPSAIGSALLADVQVSLLHQYQVAVESFGSQAQQYPDTPGQTGIEVPLTPAQLELLRKNRNVIVRISPPTDGDDSDDNPFAGFADVRVTRVRLWLTGAKVTGGSAGGSPVHVNLTHTGRETIVDVQGNPFAFSHPPVTKAFIFDAVDGTIVQDGDFLYAPIGVETTYALIGPFTSWQVQLAAADNPHLDLSGLTDARFEFHFTNYPASVS
ncbi:MAG TPA: hypothetical protein VK358_01685, partial [Longimicrobium sp.]|nr:hypothetical protein [Longimicrobium sp.]